MVTKEGEKMTDNTHYQHTPIRMMTRSRLALEPPLANRGLAAEVIKYDSCGKIFKIPLTLSKHKCINRKYGYFKIIMSTFLAHFVIFAANIVRKCAVSNYLFSFIIVCSQ